MRIPALIALFAFFTFPMAHAGDHLEPVGSIYNPKWHDEYGNLIRQSLSPAISDRYVFATALVIPSFSEEFAVSIKMSGGDYSIVGATPEKQIWIDYREALGEREELNESLPEIPIISCEVPLSPDMGSRLLDVWFEMLRRTKYPYDDKLEPPHVGLDGTNYLFAMKTGKGMVGTTRSPDEATKPGYLAEIAHNLADSCFSGTQPSLNILDPLEKLEAALASDN
ncbi:hypothetical protein FF098_005665 [Parvularcula flava]|uniref:Uncharacterized protein n=1 Tax=Aquisalinus luteolus TaxID=1566827 RepID=A0A8J3EQU6_9PROT|nr:hypothetical protein [Aquisalinus luteolus]NHK27386.1 hypothetical protein [Aquisalinus luteolus]GGH95279.1 hypothetical protein GCM10011355_11440 [Aquisalinus luteolus]